MFITQPQEEGTYVKQVPFGPWFLSIVSFPFFSVEAMALWKIEHCVLAYGSFLKNNQFVTAVKREFRHRFNIHHY